MKVKNTAMGAWFLTQPMNQASAYIAECLRTNHDPDNVFWAIVTYYDLKAETPLALGAKVLEHLMEFDLDNMNSEEQ